MLNEYLHPAHVFIACGYTDLRLGIDGLAALVQEKYQLDPFGEALFFFCGRRTDRIKGLFWDGDGFLLLYKRLERIFCSVSESLSATLGSFCQALSFCSGLSVKAHFKSRSFPRQIFPAARNRLACSCSSRAS